MEKHEKNRGKWCLPTLVIMQIALGLPYLGNIPRVFVDEAWDSALGWNIAQNGKLAHPFIEGMGGVQHCFIQPRVLLPVVSSFVFKFTDCTIFTSRLPSLGFSIIAVICLYLLVSRWFGPYQAFWSCFLMITQAWFFEISRRARPEIHYTALALLLLLVIDNYYRRSSKLTALFVGVICGLMVLAHPTGAVLAAAVFISAFIWMRPKRLVTYFLFTGLGVFIICLPYMIHLFWGVQQPGVIFSEQMQIGLLRSSIISKELSRYKNFLIFPSLVPAGLIMFFVWTTAWFGSKQEKMFVSIITLFVLILPICSVNHYPHYCAATIPFWSMLIVKFCRELLKEPFVLAGYNKIRTALVVLIVSMYLLPSLYIISNMFYSLHKADFDTVITRISERIPSGAKVYANPIFWYNQGKFDYGPYMISYKTGILLDDLDSWVKQSGFEYAIRPSWHLRPPFWAEKASQKALMFTKSSGFDLCCERYFVKIDEFSDPYYGLIEIYKFKPIRQLERY
ncbi:MAG: glycosyltransferase family 39 protein [Phycisphaerae bacterium]